MCATARALAQLQPVTFRITSPETGGIERTGRQGALCATARALALLQPVLRPGSPAAADVSFVAVQLARAALPFLPVLNIALQAAESQQAVFHEGAGTAIGGNLHSVAPCWLAVPCTMHGLRQTLQPANAQTRSAEHEGTRHGQGGPCCSSRTLHVQCRGQQCHMIMRHHTDAAVTALCAASCTSRRVTAEAWQTRGNSLSSRAETNPNWVAQPAQSSELVCNVARVVGEQPHWEHGLPSAAGNP